MPELDLNTKIEFKVDQTTIDRVEALAAIEQLDLDAWFRRLVDDLIAQGSRHMRKDHISVETLRDPVVAIIQWLADQVHPLREKARALLDQISFTFTAEIPEGEPEAEEEEEKKSLAAKVKGVFKKDEAPEVEVEVEADVEEIVEGLIELAEEEEAPEEEVEPEPEDEMVVCEICGNVFDNEKSLAAHLGWHKRKENAGKE